MTIARTVRRALSITALSLAALAGTSAAQATQDPVTMTAMQEPKEERVVQNFTTHSHLQAQCDNACLIDYVTDALLQRPAENSEIAAYSPLLAANTWTGFTKVATTIIKGNEFRNEVLMSEGAHSTTPITLLNHLYNAFLFRTLDAGAIRYSLPLVQQGVGGIGRVVTSILSSKEFNAYDKERILNREKPPAQSCGLIEKLTDGATVPTNYYGTLEHDGRTRTFFLHIPTAYFTNTRRVPLVMILHSAGGNGEGMVPLFNMTAHADRNEVIMLYPDGTPSFEGASPTNLVWNASSCCGLAVQEKVDDLGFLTSLLTRMKTQFQIDNARVYVTGYSNGAIMTQMLVANYPGLFAAAAGASGTIGGCQGLGCEQLDQNILMPPQPTIAVPYMAFHGVIDTTIPIMGGHGGDGTNPWYVVQFSEALSALHPEWRSPSGPGASKGTLDFWVAANGLENAPLIEQVPYKNNLRCTKLTYDSDPKFAVIGYGCEGIGHAWPTTSRLNAMTEFWNFFQRHVKE